MCLYVLIDTVSFHRYFAPFPMEPWFTDGIGTPDPNPRNLAN